MRAAGDVDHADVEIHVIPDQAGQLGDPHPESRPEPGPASGHCQRGRRGACQAGVTWEDTGQETGLAVASVARGASGNRGSG